MSDKYDCSVRLISNNSGSAVLVRQKDCYYLITSAHVYSGNNVGKIASISKDQGTIHVLQEYTTIVSNKENGADICVTKLPLDVGEKFSKGAKCGTFEGSGYPCEIDGCPSRSLDKMLRIEEKCQITKETEVGDGIYVKLNEQRFDGIHMDEVERGFSGSGIFVDSNGDKYLVGIVYKVENESNLFLGWKMQKVNEILRNNGWGEIPLVSIELRRRIIDQYNQLINRTNFILSKIKCTIVNNINIPRDGYKKKLIDAINKYNIVVVTGEAGIGKSALVKEAIATSAFKSVAVVGDDLDKSKDEEILEELKIKDSLADLYLSPIWGDGKKVLLVESAERMMNGNTETAIAFLENVLKERKDLTAIFTIRKRDEPLFLFNMCINNLRISDEQKIDVKGLTNDELHVVEQKISNLSPYLLSEKTRKIVAIPFYLNLACSLSFTLNTELLDEDKFKDMLCRQIIEDRSLDSQSTKQRIDSLVSIARESANAGQSAVKCEVLESVESLYEDKILDGDIQEGMLRPSHDVLTDWGLSCYLENQYDAYLTHHISLRDFYESLDSNVAARNVFRKKIDSMSLKEPAALNEFIADSLTIKLDDYVYDDFFYAILTSDSGSAFLASIKVILLKDNGYLLKRLSIALSYMFRKIDWDSKNFLEDNGALVKGVKYRNSQFMLPSGKGWMTFVKFLYLNREVYYTASNYLIPLLLECELVAIKGNESELLSQYVFEILADDVDRMYTNELSVTPQKGVLRLLFKWMRKDKTRIRKWAEQALTDDSYKYDSIKELIMLGDNMQMSGFTYYCSDLYKEYVKTEWLDEHGIVKDYYPMISQSSAISTSFYSYMMVNNIDGVMFLCDILNYDIDKLRADSRNDIETIEVTINGNKREVYGNITLWREYRGRNYTSHVRECMLMAFEKWLLSQIENNLSEAKYALEKNIILRVFDLVYTNCCNVALWGVLASVATKYPTFVGLKAMPIYGCLTFILWDKSRCSSEIQQSFISPFASKIIQKEVAESNNMPHRKEDLEKNILQLSMTDGYREIISKLIQRFKDNSTTFIEKVAIGRMDVSQYRVMGETNKGLVLQGSPYKEIKEEANLHNAANDAFTKLIEWSNTARKRYDEVGKQNFAEWENSYHINDNEENELTSKGLIAAWGVKKFWDRLGCRERKWCINSILQEVKSYCISGTYPVYIEYSSDGLLYLLDKEIGDKEIRNEILNLIDAIGDNDGMFTRFEDTYKKVIWKKNPLVADAILNFYLIDSGSKRSDLSKFEQICKFIPTDIMDNDWIGAISRYFRMYFAQWSDKNTGKYEHIQDTRMDMFCAEFMIAKPKERSGFIKDVWLESISNSIINRPSEYDNTINTVFTHFCYVAKAENKSQFWELWEIILDWWNQHHNKVVLSALMLRFELMQPSLMDNWAVLDGAKIHINKLLPLLRDDAEELLPSLVCKMGFNELLPDSLRYINLELLRTSSRNIRNIKKWQDAIEDLYEDTRLRDFIRNDSKLKKAFGVILDGLISNGSAIAYIIRDYYI